MSAKKLNRYQALVASLFHGRYSVGIENLPFTRQELIAKADELKIEMPKNPGDVLYSFRYSRSRRRAARTASPASRRSKTSPAAPKSFRTSSADPFPHNSWTIPGSPCSSCASTKAAS